MMAIQLCEKEVFLARTAFRSDGSISSWGMP
jgi:hypothetical protein